MVTQTLTPEGDLAARRKPRFPGESAEYAAARETLLAEEIAFRRYATRSPSSVGRFRPAPSSPRITASRMKTASTPR